MRKGKGFEKYRKDKKGIYGRRRQEMLKVRECKGKKWIFRENERDREKKIRDRAGQ